MGQNINWDDPTSRLRLAETVGPTEYNRLIAEHIQNSSVATVNGHAIRPVSTRFGRLFAVGNTGMAYRTLDEAKQYAGGIAEADL